MLRLREELADICQKHLFHEKILIMPSFRAGQQLLQQLALETIPVLNLKVETIYHLVFEILQESLFKEEYQVIDGKTQELLFLKILEDLRDEKSLNYFDSLELSRGFIKALCRTVEDLYVEGYSSQSLKGEEFLVEEKGEDLIKILLLYEQLLKEKKYIDYPHLLKLACRERSTSEKTIFILPDLLKTSLLEKEFLEEITRDATTYTLSLNPALGLPLPSYQKTTTIKPFNSLHYLYDLSSLPKEIEEIDLHITKATGETCEVLEVLRRIKRDSIPFHEVAILFTTREPYSQLFYSIGKHLDLPLTFGEGLPIEKTRPGRFYSYLLQWIEEDYDYSILHEILKEGLIELPQGLSTSRACSLLRSLKIGWGRERYLQLLQKAIEDMKREEQAQEKKREYYSQKREYYQILHKVFLTLFSTLPTPQKALSIGEYARALQEIMRGSTIKDPLDGEASTIIEDSLTSLQDLSFPELPPETLYRRLRDVIAGQRVGLSSPQVGEIHITSYQKGFWFNRRHTFIVGLDGRRFPGGATEDPILLDDERERLGHVETTKERSKERLYQMVQLLASLNGSLYLSYSSLDILEGREVAPSPLLLQVHRLMKKDQTLDYSSLFRSLEPAASFVAESKKDLLDEGDLWLYYVGEGVDIHKNSILSTLYKGTARGNKAIEERMSNTFNPYNGKVYLDPSMVDPRENHQIILSASMLENLATCPYLYFLKHILKVYLPDDFTKDPWSWLDSLSRGLLLHQVFEEFYREILKRKERPSLCHQEDLIYQILEREVEQICAHTPPPSKVVYELELEELRESCYLFLSCEEEYAASTRPLYLELSFGIEGTVHGKLGPLKPVVLTLPSKKTIRLRGKIDRVDGVDKKTYQIIDYKTGGTYGYTHTDYFKQGQQIQHALYALALEQILGEGSKVLLSGYLFPALKGEGQRFMRPKQGRDRVLKLLDLLLDTVSSGGFVPACFDKKHTYCRICDYLEICHRQQYDSLSFLRENCTDPCLQQLRRLEEYG